MADQSSRRPWAGITDDVLYEVVLRVPCEVDRIHVGRVCHSWRVVLAKLKPPAPPPPLPWLVLPRADGSPTFSCVLSGCRTHPFFVPDNAHRSRYFGSYDSAWLFFAVDGQAQDHVLVFSILGQAEAQAQRHFLLKLSNPFQLLVLPTWSATTYT
ncbi:hypothetical protein E2562_010004 [Oryza meyeriana var. granulata]|uniref:F-box domain-containing protein n=1 Tax=Oryza meyeriana var. granulata TaxID=110450 RepID=A0A6G1EIR1_9ORYZ|nr:hypothetical protein E2562_010004 [Oryza meyeriana var. granulata]